MRSTILFFSFILLLSCEQVESTFSANADSPQVAFAIEILQNAVAGNFEAGDRPLAYVFNLKEGEGETGSYTITCSAKRVEISSPDANGLMYGGMEVAEQRSVSMAGWRIPVIPPM